MILAFDTSVEGFSVGLLDLKGAVVHQISNIIPYSHTQFLVPAINQVLCECNTEFSNLTKIITTNGPGSFTGIRVGLATAAGLQAALNIPVVTVNTLTVLAYAWLQQKIDVPIRIHAVLDTKCGEVYHQVYKYQHDDLVPLTDPASILTSALEQGLQPEDYVIAPLSSSEVLKTIPHEVVSITLSSMWQAASDAQPSNLQPLYVRPAIVARSKQAS